MIRVHKRWALLLLILAGSIFFFLESNDSPDRKTLPDHRGQRHFSRETRPAEHDMTSPGMPSKETMKQAPSADMAVLTGKVTDTHGTLLKGTEIRHRFGDAENVAITDDHGEYTISGLKPVRGKVTVVSGGFSRLGRDLTLQTGINHVDWILGEGDHISGIAVDEQTGQPISNIWVIICQSNQTIGSDQTDMDGRYRVDGLYPGNYDVDAFGMNYVFTKTEGIPSNTDRADLKGTPLGTLKIQLDYSYLFSGSHAIPRKFCSFCPV